LRLPEGFKELISGQFPSEISEQLMDSLMTKVSGRHAVFHKMTPDEWMSSVPHLMEFTKNQRVAGGVHFSEGYMFSHCPGYYCGLYYPQEASASEVVSLLPDNLNLVLDLCAAPGGKSIQLSQKLSFGGCLISNELVPKRAKILSQNLERAGVKHRVLMSNKAEELNSIFGPIFDAVLVDAPCSGEGMFRKDPNTVEEWSLKQVKICVDRQKEILSAAAGLVVAGGYLLYSTCTFNRDENEGQMEMFLASHPEFQMVSMIRLWPFEVPGEGHFACLLRRGDAFLSPAFEPQKNEKARKCSDLPSVVHEFLLPTGSFEQGRDGFWFYPEAIKKHLPFSKAQRVCYEPGIRIFDSLSKPGFTHALSLILPPGVWPEALHIEDERLFAFLRGETLNTNLPPGVKQVLWENLPLGFGKQIPSRLQNMIPKGLRTFVPRTNLPVRPNVPVLSQTQNP